MPLGCWPHQVMHSATEAAWLAQLISLLETSILTDEDLTMDERRKHLALQRGLDHASTWACAACPEPAEGRLPKGAGSVKRSSIDKHLGEASAELSRVAQDDYPRSLSEPMSSTIGVPSTAILTPAVPRA